MHGYNTMLHTAQPIVYRIHLKPLTKGCFVGPLAVPSHSQIPFINAESVITLLLQHNYEYNPSMKVYQKRVRNGYVQVYE
jgi:hypothetical protein